MEIVTTSEGQLEETPLANLKKKDRFTGKVVKTTLAGVIVDIGLDIPGVVHISQLQEEPVNRVEDVVQVGQQVEVWVRRVFPKKNRIELTMIKPLILEWREIENDMTLKGKVVRLEKYGVFIDIGAERPGLVHISEMSHGYIKGPEDIVKDGDEVDVMVLQVSRRKKQIKLSMKALQAVPTPEEKQPVNTRRPGRVKSSHEEIAKVAEEQSEPMEEEVHMPTAMEFALRKAMERTKDERRSEQKQAAWAKKKNKGEDIFSRTLESRIGK